MEWLKSQITVETRGKGLYPFTDQVIEHIRKWGIQEGMCFLFIQHTSASLLISESYDRTARIDLEEFMERVAPESQSWHQHTLEGSDDSPSHMKAMLTDTDLTIPINNQKLSLGTWQGLYVFEHRKRGHNRQILIRCLKIK